MEIDYNCPVCTEPDLDDGGSWDWVNLFCHNCEYDPVEED